MIESEFYQNKKNLKILKPNQLIDAGYDLNVSEYNLLTLAINKYWYFIDSTESFGDGKVLITAKEFSTANQCTLSHSYDVFKTCSLNLLGKKVKYTLYIDEKSDESFFTFIKPKHKKFKMLRSTYSWLDTIDYSNNNGTIILGFSRMLILLIGSTKTSYTKFHFDKTKVLTTTNAKKLYELAVKWKKIQKVEFSVYDFREFFGVEGNTSYYDSTEFKRRVVTPAIKQINEKTEFKLTLKSIKTSNFITHFRLLIETIEKTNITSQNDKVATSKDKNINHLLQSVTDKTKVPGTSKAKRTNNSSRKNPKEDKQNPIIAQDSTKSSADNKALIRMLCNNPLFVKDFIKENETKQAFLERLSVEGLPIPHSENLEYLIGAMKSK